MPTPREVIAKLRKKGDLDIGDGVILPLFRQGRGRPQTDWVQYSRRRMQFGNGSDEVYYEVYNVENQLVAQLHYKCSEGADSEMLRQLLDKAKKLNFCDYEGYSRIGYRRREMGYLISCRKPINVAGCDVDAILKSLTADIKKLYDVFEGIITKYDSQCHTATKNVERIKKRSDNKKPSDKKWFVNYKYDTSACDDQYDDELKAISGLTWLPWVGKGYCDTGILVVGESNYTDDGMAEIVESDPLFTRKVSDYFCIKELGNGQTMPNIARRLMTSVHDTVPKVWSRIAYMDVCQKCLIQVEGERPRPPTPDNFQGGVLPVCSVVNVLRPKLVIFVSIEACSYFEKKQCLEELSREGISVKCKSGKTISLRQIVGLLCAGKCKVPVVFTTHTSSRWCRIVSHAKWRRFLKEHFQDIVPYCKDIVTE